MASVVVIGSIGGDIVATAARHPRPGETVLGHGLMTAPGGKGANQAAAAALAGAATAMVGRVGDDQAGAAQRAFLGGLGVELSGVATDTEQPTQTAIIVVDGAGENAIVVIPGASGEVSEGDADRARIGAGDVVVCQGEIPLATVVHAFERARARGATTVLNLAPAAPPPAGLLAATDVLVVNESEAADLLGRPLPAGADDAEIERAARELAARGPAVVVVTLGAAGCFALTPEPVRIDGHSVSAVDTTGAGDCFVGYFAASLAAGLPLAAALARANRAASICVGRAGAGVSLPASSEVDSAVAT